ncbi:MAG: helix-turn-helix transcriptional regulator [bacterium]|nr:helix-turn-helix transcriptional regulator [bacterium]
MIAKTVSDILDTLRKQRNELQMPYGVLAQRSGLSLSTVQRAMTGNSGRIDTLLSLAGALGVRLNITVTPPRKLRNEQANNQAHKLAGFAQGNSAMEGQGVPQGTLREVQQNLKDRLLVGTNRRLWGE